MIEFRGVSFTYPDSERGALHDISLSIADGECVLLCGRSGCGKTTLTRLVNGLIPQFYPGELSGEVLLDGQNVDALPMYKIAQSVGSVFQNPRTQFFNVDTDSEIAFGMESQARPQSELEARVAQTARDLHLEHLLARNIFSLSGGEKQKIAFASIYAANPQTYLLDEPSSNLDMESIERLREYLQLIKDSGKTIIIAEHRLYYLQDLVDRVIYLENGRIAGEYSPAQFQELPAAQRQEKGLRAVDLSAEQPQYFEAPDAGAVLEIQDLSVAYRQRSVLERISLSARPGDVIAVTGKNGAGKTTFARTLCGLHKETGGTISWKGQALKPQGRLQRSYLVMQDVNYQLFAENVEAECTFGIKNPDFELARNTLKNLGLANFTARHPNTLSGGQKQRLTAAVAMVCGREILVFDEPTSGLDYDSMNRLSCLVRELSDLGKVIFFVTHDYEFSCRTCNRVLHLGEGAIHSDLPISEAAQDQLHEIFALEN